MRTLYLPALTAALLWSPARADDSFMSLFSSTGQSAIGAATSGVAGAAAGGPVNAKAFEYTPSGQVSTALRDQVLNVFIKAGRANGKLTPTLEQQLRTEFGKLDVAKAWGAQLEPKGFKMNSLATATALWVGSSLQIMQGGADTSDAQDAALVRQFQVAYSKSPGAAKLSDAEKQRAAEAMLWMAAFQAYDYQQAKAGAKGWSMDAVKDYVGKLLKNFKLDPALIELGESGIRKKGG